LKRGIRGQIPAFGVGYIMKDSGLLPAQSSLAAALPA
jgi:hypothetical protein